MAGKPVFAIPVVRFAICGDHRREGNPPGTEEKVTAIRLATYQTGTSTTTASTITARLTILRERVAGMV